MASVYPSLVTESPGVPAQLSPTGWSLPCQPGLTIRVLSSLHPVLTLSVSYSSALFNVQFLHCFLKRDIILNTFKNASLAASLLFSISITVIFGIFIIIRISGIGQQVLLWKIKFKNLTIFFKLINWFNSSTPSFIVIKTVRCWAKKRK